MLNIAGKYNTALVIVDDIDESTRSQIQRMVDDPSFAGSPIRIMPDCHAGAGACIGFTMPMNDCIIPSIVGVDIGCGMLSAKFDIEDFDIPAFDRYVKETIPAGFAIRKKAFLPGFVFPDAVTERLGADHERALLSIGTLGGGNHFIEAGYGSDGKLWLTVHTGSRNLGLKIANFHQEKAKELCVSRGEDRTRIPFLYVHSPEGQAYLEDQIFASLYANTNRLVVMTLLSEFFKKAPVDMKLSVHNFIDNDGMIRKGATPARQGHPVIIPFNMRDGIAICIGKGNDEYNCSAPHGAGRILSRAKAKATLDATAFKEEMKRAGVYTTTATEATLDEAPGAYKDKETILENIKDTVCISEWVKPVYNFKACGE